MDRLSKSYAKEYYLLTDDDLGELSFVTKNNFLNSSNDIKLYKKEDIISKAVYKYGSIETIMKKVEIKKNEKIKRKISSKKTKLDKKNQLLEYFKSQDNFANEEDIISEYPCYLYIEYSEKKFMKEVDNKINYNLQSIYNISSNRIQRRHSLVHLAKKNNIILKPECDIYNSFINSNLDINSAFNLLFEEDFLNKKTIFLTVLKKHNDIQLEDRDIELIKDDCIYFYLVSTKNPDSFPKLIQDRVDNVIKIIIFIKENLNIDLSNNDEANYNMFLKIINLRKQYITTILTSNKKNNIPDIILDKFLNSESSISYEISL
ncbi:hypothetical protein CPAV1605_1539 [seawater metagenome]|uniref:XPA C-terminal domain-containing protein n=1 Tax=seawater metagenome TaxID=1561972 RepID=A0A5E8CK42_9ZZZZ